jgi:hypothetical protein
VKRALAMGHARRRPRVPAARRIALGRGMPRLTPAKPAVPVPRLPWLPGRTRRRPGATGAGAHAWPGRRPPALAWVGTARPSARRRPARREPARGPAPPAGPGRPRGSRAVRGSRRAPHRRGPGSAASQGRPRTDARPMDHPGGGAGPRRRWRGPRRRRRRSATSAGRPARPSARRPGWGRRAGAPPVAASPWGSAPGPAAPLRRRRRPCPCRPSRRDRAPPRERRGSRRP